jgi:hypothetical protein
LREGRFGQRPFVEQERRYLEALGAVTAHRTESGTLSLLDASGRVRVRLVSLPR